MQGQMQIMPYQPNVSNYNRKETCNKFIKYAECRLWATIYKIYWDFNFHNNNFFTGKKTIVGTISVTITDSSDVWCFGLYLINIFTKSTKDIMFKLTLYCLTITKFVMKIDEDINILGTQKVTVSWGFGHCSVCTSLKIQ